MDENTTLGQAEADTTTLTDFSELDEGDECCGKRISHLILARTDFIVFLDDDLYVWWQHGEIDASQNFGKILIDVATLEAVPIFHLHRETQIAFRRMLGEAIARALDGESKSAAAGIVLAKSFVSEKLAERSRTWILSVSLIIAAISTFALILLWTNRVECAKWIGEGAFRCGVCSIFGGYGVFLSIAARLGNQVTDANSGIWLHALETVGRFATGVLGALLTVLAVKSGLIFSFVDQVPAAFPALLVLSIASGASERLIPGIIAKVDSRVLEPSDPNGQSKLTNSEPKKE